MKKQEKIFCDQCKQELEKYKWNLSLTYSTHGNDWKKNLCKGCASELMDVSIVDMAFFEELVKFKFKYNLSKWNKWDDSLVKEFREILQGEGIPLVKIPIWCRDREQPFYLPKTKEVVEKVEEKIKEVDEIYEEEVDEEEDVVDDDKVILGDKVLSKKRFNQVMDEIGEV